MSSITENCLYCGKPKERNTKGFCSDECKAKQKIVHNKKNIAKRQRELKADKEKHVPFKYSLPSTKNYHIPVQLLNCFTFSEKFNMKSRVNDFGFDRIMVDVKIKRADGRSITYDMVCLKPSHIRLFIYIRYKQYCKNKSFHTKNTVMRWINIYKKLVRFINENEDMCRLWTTNSRIQ
ncbi:MAG: hypothetical protein ACPG9K_00955 [Poseidonibacter sp.]